MVVCTLDWEFGICIRWGVSVLEIGVTYSIGVNIALDFGD